jgi:hypothetical protein
LTGIQTWHGPAKYEVQVLGHLEGNWFDWFTDISITADSGVTTIVIEVADQATLQGVLSRIFNFGLPLLSVQRM